MVLMNWNGSRVSNFGFGDSFFELILKICCCCCELKK